MSILLTLALIALLVIGGSSQSIDARNASTSVFVPSMSIESRASIEYRVFELINRERQERGVRPLKWTDKAATVARFHSDNMATSNFMGHRDQAGRSVADRASSFGLNNWRTIGENVAWISGSRELAERAVSSWMRSPGHRRNILEARFAETGLGFAIGNDGKYYFTQVFVSPR